MLSEETAIGEYPVEAVATMDTIARAVEPSLGHRHELPSWQAMNRTVGEAISNAACDIAEKALHAVALVVPTFTPAFTALPLRAAGGRGPGRSGLA